MSRLIDADALIEVIKKYKKNGESILNDGIVKEAYGLALDHIKEIIENVPTFDAIEYGKKCYMQGKEDWIDVVVAKLECAESVKNFGSRNSGNLLIPLNDAIEIVRKGGIDG